MELFVVLQKIVPQKLITFLAGLLAGVAWVPIKNLLINQFIRVHKVDMSEAAMVSASQYRTFNEFFTRALRPGARPIDQAREAVVSPADGVISETGVISEGRLMQAKGIDYSAARLLGDAELADELEAGVFATVYLSPKDYHRVHMPLDGTPLNLRYIPGKLFSVNRRTAENLESLFARNERLVATFQRNEYKFAVVLVGAMIVGGMKTVLTGPVSRSLDIQDLVFDRTDLKKGDELGRFYLGSTAILLLPRAMGINLREELCPGGSIRMGEQIARIM